MNKRNKTLVLSTIAILAFSFIIGSIYLASAESYEEENDAYPSFTPFGWKKPGGMMGLLDDEQKAELKESIEALQHEGASFEEIREYVRNYIEEQGIELPDPEQMKPELTEEQLELYEQLRKDVQEYAEKRAEELGIELIPHHGFFNPGKCGRYNWGKRFFMPEWKEG
jgi:hypothetical protein